MKYIVTVNDKDYEVEVEKSVAQLLSVTKTQSAPAVIVPTGPVIPVATVPAAAEIVTGEIISAPMPGVILNIVKTVGDRVKSGEVILTLEAMKMENEITAIKDGIVAQLLTAKGASVSTGTPLVVIQ